LLLVVGVVDLMQTAAAVAAVLVDYAPTSEARLIRSLLLRYIPSRSAAVALVGHQQQIALAQALKAVFRLGIPTQSAAEQKSNPLAVAAGQMKDLAAMQT
jgi:hypothetical protein